jgi:hypothetical protein
MILYFRTHIQPVICDDAFITLKSALNFAEGRGLTFNADQRIWLVTTPAWALLLAAGRLVLSDIILSAKVWAVIFEVCFIASIVHLGYILSGNRWTGFLLGVLVVTNPVYIFTSLSGMEISLSLFVITLTLILIARTEYLWALVVSSIAVWVRFDNLLLFFVALVSAVWLMKGEQRKSAAKWIRIFTAPILIIGGYFLFGYVCFGDLVPTSVQAKTIHGAIPFTSGWFDGIRIVANEFWKVVIGKSGPWFAANTPFWIIAIPCVFGAIRIFKARNLKALPLLIFTFIYLAAYIGSGNFYAQFFPWYFVPILPGIYYLSAEGLMWIIDRAVNTASGIKVKNGRGELFAGIKNLFAVVLGVCWFYFMLGPIALDGEHVQALSDIRERSYAATTIWLGNHLDENAMVASLEIGVIGFYARPDMRILDLFGILRPREDRWINAIDLVNRYRPEAVIIIQPFLLPRYMNVESRAKYEAARLDYEWFEYKGLEVGLRNDIQIPDFDELERIYGGVDMGREYVWGEE